jgi:hypothetical protein
MKHFMVKFFCAFGVLCFLNFGIYPLVSYFCSGKSIFFNMDDCVEIKSLEKFLIEFLLLILATLIIIFVGAKWKKGSNNTQ